MLEVTEHGTETLRGPGETRWRLITSHRFCAPDGIQELKPSPIQSNKLPRGPTSTDADQGGPQTTIDQGQLTAPELHDQHVRVRVEGFTDLVDQLTRWMSPPRAGNRRPGHDRTERRNG